MLGIDTEIESKTRDRAYAIWEAEGRPEGRATDHWLAAETECRPAAKPKLRVRRTSKANGVAAGRSARSSATAGKQKSAAPRGR
ncbi:MAG: DUF2934 domain-containing protein [Geminicoccaceae bacterium]